MAKRVGTLLMRNLAEAIRQRRIDLGDSEPRWLESEKCRELEDGRIEFSPSKAPELMAYAEAQGFRPVGLVVMDDQGGCRPLIDEEAILGCDRDFALRVFHLHAQFWFLICPGL
ncbi:MAG TPA: hypothetical protein VJP02_17555 [Candidatus Sulfotelmatobacter sp.]|nr:hypothetical protein [Candidatus Sulfotelmatobacter sp.]